MTKQVILSEASTDEGLSQRLKHLTPRHLIMIDEVIAVIGGYGEVHLWEK